MRFNCGPSLQERRNARALMLREKMQRFQVWHSYFAWMPIRVGESVCCWMETVERRYVGGFVYCGRRIIRGHRIEYRAMNSVSTEEVK